MSPLVWLTLFLAAAAGLLALGAVGAWPVAYRRGYARAELEAGERHRHRRGDPQATVLLELPRAGRLPLARLADPTPLPGELRFAGGWDEGGSGPWEYDLLTRPTEQSAAEPVGTTTDEIRAITAKVDAWVADWQARGNWDRHTIQAGE